MELNDLVKHYLITALWSSNDEEGTPFDENFGVEDFSGDSLEKAIKDCEEFVKKAGDILDRYEDTSIGHDFWLTRNRHGAGFWDGDYGKEDGEKLTEISESFGEINIHKGDDNKLHIF